MSSKRAGLLAMILVVIAYSLIQIAFEPKETGHKYRARLSDASGLPVGAPIYVAGLQMGEIRGYRVGQGFAEVEMAFQKGIVLYQDATLYKKRASMLSGPFLEIDPGSKESGLLEGDYVLRVVETNPIGQVLTDISEALPGTARAAESGVDWAEDWRARVNGPWQAKLGEFDRKTGDIQRRMHNRLAAIQKGLEGGDTIEYDARKSIGGRLDRAEEMTDFARRQLATGRTWVIENAQRVRKAVDDSEIDWDPYVEPIREVDEGIGTLGRLLNETDVHDDALDTVDGMHNFVRSLTDWKMGVGLRAEYGFWGSTGRSYVTLLAGRSNRYYYIEVETSGRGGYPQATLTYDPTLDRWRRSFTIENKPRVTFQWANRVGSLMLRYGIKESSFGGGADFYLFDDQLEISADVFEFGTRDYPRVKLTAAYQLFGSLYLLAGLDDVLNPGVNLDIEPLASEVPRTFEKLYLGRDFFLGGTLRFTDDDLVKLLLIGGGAVAAVNQ